MLYISMLCNVVFYLFINAISGLFGGFFVNFFLFVFFYFLFLVKPSLIGENRVFYRVTALVGSCCLNNVGKMFVQLRTI